MLERFITNSLDMINIIYLWTVLMKKNHEISKFLSSVVITSTLITIIERLDLNAAITYAMIIIVIKIIYKVYLKEIILGFFLIILIEMSLQLILFLIIGKFVYDETAMTIITELIILISIIIFSKINFSRNITFKNMDNNILIYFISTCSIYAIIFKIIWNYDEKIILNNLLITSVILSILVVSQILTYVYIVKVTKEKETLKVSNEYNSVIGEIVQEIKRRQHDFVNYKNTIRGIVEVVDEKDVKSAINSYMKDDDIYDNEINELIYINNIVVISILYRYIGKAKKYHINFKYDIQNNVLDDKLSYHEISNVLNNLLNNAFEEVMKEQCINKNIEIKIFAEKNTSHLIVKNQIANANDFNLNEMFKRGYSTKNADNRGYGLYNVQQIINSHKGYIKLKVEYGEIIFDIYFNNS
ncbi:sensor histidine kinase [Clostridium beijerinckii]|nr:GHKL domain-containing protein [Clostridium beijerinckii]NRT43893.1 two-component system sensor histidine kinase AgrC [Clostridium beijerinckii]NRU37581.1 two-component system sensor histidine kinase AgrC [Clostridium beijerinckii]NRZ22113.1 two-component system sensor histidine kinase AgrC [Clostridium beijerinckii]NSA99140.1 two-component system sensor histidine kinase AgrC [Clostridium beijerinckii]NYC71328.1 two-component system sensor histidine kinase AgrC [Clostridium beijerinckii]